MRSSILALLPVLSVALAAPAQAEPLPVRAGKVVLPISGLALDLPKDKRANATWAIAGSWSLTNDGTTFDGRDVIDQKVDGRLVHGNWIHVGYFDAGDCAAVVAQASLADRFTAERDLYGTHFQVAGGSYDLGASFGSVPTLVLCAVRPEGESLLIYHFFLEPDAVKGEAGLTALAADPLLQRVTRAWRDAKYGAAEPSHRPEITRRGTIEAVRAVTLPKSGLALTLPDDGAVWMVRSGEDGETDFLDRMAPALPDLSLEVARAPGATCDELLATSAAPIKKEPKPLGVPAGWKAFPTLQLERGLERLVCREQAGVALVVGLIANPATAPAARDFGPLSAMLEVLARSSDAK